VPADDVIDPDWEDLLQEAVARHLSPVSARRHDGGIETATRPQKLICGDEERLFAVKFIQNNHGDGRGIASEQIVARLGRLIGACVAEVAVVDVSAELVEVIRASPDSHLDFVPLPGLHHGSMWALGFSDRQHLAFIDENRQAFAALHVLAAWAFCNGDHQWIYRNEPPHDVLSVDHTTFFPAGPAWTPQSLAQGEAAVTRDSQFDSIGLAPDEYDAVLERVAAVSAENLAEVVSAPPDDWGLSPTDRKAVASYLWTRRDRVEQAVRG
jgi:hypothetical protein